MSIVIDCGAGLVLTPRRPEEAEEMFRLTDANRAYLREWLPWLDRCVSVEDTARSISVLAEEATRGESLGLSIRLRGELVGVTGYNSISASNRTAWIGYWLSEHVRGRGLMSRAVGGLTDHGFRHRGLNRQVIAAATGNRASCRVAEKLGYRLEGVAREAEWLYGRKVDHAIYSMLASEWVLSVHPR